MSVAVLNTDANLSGKTLVTAEGADTITGAKTFNRNPNAPFAVTSGSSVVTNLDADKLDGLDALNWTTFTPTTTNLTIGNGQILARYARLGNIVFFKVDISWGSTTSAGGGLTITFPVNAITTASFHVGHGEAIDASAGQSYHVRMRLTSGTTFICLTGDGASSSQVGTSSPMVWAQSDELHLQGTYEAA